MLITFDWILVFIWNLAQRYLSLIARSGWKNNLKNASHYEVMGAKSAKFPFWLIDPTLENEILKWKDFLDFFFTNNFISMQRTTISYLKSFGPLIVILQASIVFCIFENFQKNDQNKQQLVLDFYFFCVNNVVNR